MLQQCFQPLSLSIVLKDSGCTCRGRGCYMCERLPKAPPFPTHAVGSAELRSWRYMATAM